jgi:putative transposase
MWLHKFGMGHTYVFGRIHAVFSTKDRADYIKPEIQDQLWPYLGGIARKNGMSALAVGGFTNHCHILLAYPATIPLSKAMQLLKGGSSRWMRETLTPAFEWQDGYAAFTVGLSQVPRTVQYINSQAEIIGRSVSKRSSSRS